VENSQINENLDQYEDQVVTVEGYLGHKKYHGSCGYSILIDDYQQFFIREQLPENTYVLIDDTNYPITPDYEGKKLRVTGTVQEYDGYSVTPVAVITADTVEVIG